MLTSLAFTALLMGLVGGPHCVAMCGAACAGIGRAAEPRHNLALLTFQAGRMVGYAALGALAAASLQGLGWLTVHSAALRPVWSMFHVAALVLGLVLVWQARQPLWLEGLGRRIWAKVKAGTGRQDQHSALKAAGVLGMLWALLPCGLLYSAVLVAAMAGSVWGGALVMALFALGTAVAMTAGPWLWLRMRRNAPLVGHGRSRVWVQGQWGVRLAGAALAASSAWALWMALAHNAAPWCAFPSP